MTSVHNYDVARFYLDTIIALIYKYAINNYTFWVYKKPVYNVYLGNDVMDGSVKIELNSLCRTLELRLSTVVDSLILCLFRTTTATNSPNFPVLTWICESS